MQINAFYNDFSARPRLMQTAMLQIAVFRQRLDRFACVVCRSTEYYTVWGNFVLQAQAQ